MEKIEDLQSTAKKISEAGEKVEEARRTLSAVVNTVKSVITRVGEFFSGLFNRKK